VVILVAVPAVALDTEVSMVKSISAVRLIRVAIRTIHSTATAPLSLHRNDFVLKGNLIISNSYMHLSIQYLILMAKDSLAHLKFNRPRYKISVAFQGKALLGGEDARVLRDTSPEFNAIRI